MAEVDWQGGNAGGSGRCDDGVRIEERGESPVLPPSQVGVFVSLHKNGTDAWPGMMFPQPFFVDQRHLAVMDVHGAAALVPAGLGA